VRASLLQQAKQDACSAPGFHFRNTAAFKGVEGRPKPQSFWKSKLHATGLLKAVTPACADCHRQWKGGEL